MHHDDAHADATLRNWFASLEADVPEDFADSVISRIERDDAAATRAALARRGGGPRMGFCLVSALAAAVVAALVGRGLLGGEAAAPPGAPSPVVAWASDPTLTELREQAVATLRAQCTPCHDGTHPEAVAAAVKVLDVSDPHWYAAMSEHDLDVAAASVDDDARSQFGAYVSAELAARRRGAIDLGI